jgi:hypothetical protein
MLSELKERNSLEVLNTLSGLPTFTQQVMAALSTDTATIARMKRHTGMGSYMRVNEARVNPVGIRSSSNSPRRPPEQTAPDGWPDNREAMRVELSPAAKGRIANNAVAASNVDSAASADFLVSPAGMALVSELLPRPRR